MIRLIYVVNSNVLIGVCNSKHDVLDFDSAIWNQKITTDDMETDTFTTATVHDLSEAFVLPLENDCNRVQQFELRYIRDGEVIGRSTVLPVGKSLWLWLEMFMLCKSDCFLFLNSRKPNISPDGCGIV